MDCLDGMDLDLNLKAQIQILCLSKLKEMDLNLAQIHLGFQESKSMDLKSPHKPKNLEIHRLTHPVSLWVLRVSLPSCNSGSSSISLSATSGLFLSTLIFLFNISNSLFGLNLNTQRL